jgi:beta-galactosidase
LIVQILVPKWVSWILQPLIFLGVLDRSHHYHWNKCNLDPMAPPKSVCCKAIVDNNINDNDAIIRLESAIISQRDGSELFSSVMTYHLFANGCVQVTYNLCPCKQIQKLSSLPRVGVSMTIDKSLYKINYFGRGPHENYPDRKSSAFMGVWGASPNHMGSYIVPGESSARMDCEWVTFQNEDGKGICILGDDGGGDNEYTPLQYQRQAAGEDSAHSSFSFSALLHTQKELHAATNTNHLENREEGKHTIHVNIDHKIHGVGDSA